MIDDKYVLDLYLLSIMYLVMIYVKNEPPNPIPRCAFNIFVREFNFITCTTFLVISDDGECVPDI